MPKKKPSLFERLTGAIKIEDQEEDFIEEDEQPSEELEDNFDGEEVGQLTVDMHETDNDIVIKSIVAGVKPEDLDISISREMVTIKGKREGDTTVKEGNYFHRELYWGSFSRTIILPSEIDTDLVEAVEKHGLLIIKLPKINKDKQTKVKVKSH
ncbi:MAG: Hsp20/alpha crystallin family protein [Candidatus Pacebacteria bacterium]|nr:Hsp20/alpha crystallin family protein [Candidatus Paceibacterota bacterium]